MNSREKKLILIYLIIDLIMLNSSMIVIYCYKYHFSNWTGINQVLIVFNTSWFLSLIVFKRKHLFFRDGFPNRVKRNAIRFSIYMAVSSSIIVVFNIDSLPRSFYLVGSFIFFILNFIFYYFAYLFIGYLRYKGRFVRKVVIVGAGKTGMDVTDFIEKNRDMGYSVVGYLDDNTSLQREIPILGTTNELQSVYEKYSFKEIIIALPLNQETKINQLLNIADFNGLRIRIIPDFYRLVKCNYSIDSKDEISFLNVRKIPLDNFTMQCCKRAFDILFSLAILIFILPILIVVAIAIRIESEGAVFYKPVRLGQGGKEFTVFKFRSMKVCDSEQTGKNSTSKDDKRITRVGRFIRKYSIDELPQFLNVLLGDMSVVGPRPHRILLNKDMQRKVQGYMMRHYVRPGITGWAQVNGWRGPTETRLQRNGRTLHDLWYIENWTFLLDIWIVILTVFGVKTRENAF